MMSRLSRLAARSALCGILTLTAGIAAADVTLERTMAVEGAGMMSMGNMSGTTRTTISGDKSRTDSDIQMKSRLVRMLAHGATGPTAEIIRLDTDRIYHLNINKKEYRETSFEEMRAGLQKAQDQTSQAPEKGERKQPSAIDESKCEWLPPKADVRKTGEKAQIGGYDSERVVITAAQPCKDKETGSICEVALVLDQWLSPGFAESAEVRKFYKAYAAKMGLDSFGSADFAERAKALFSQYKGIWSEIAARMQGTKGYPVKTSFTLAIGGAQCQNANARQAQSNDSGGDSASNGPGGLAGAMAGKLGGLFHKKKDGSDSGAAAQPAPAVIAAPVPPGDVAVMTISSQLVSVSNAAASPDAFTVPADFKKLENKTP